MNAQIKSATKVKVCPANEQDAKRIAVLGGQLGYPSTLIQVLQRIERIRDDREHAVFVAESKDGQVTGWLHIFVCRLMESDPYAEIGGLIVDELHRSSGIGQLLMQHAEEWAHAKGCRSIRLRCNIIRERAHEFYKRLGYGIVKTQHAFSKAL